VIEKECEEMTERKNYKRDKGNDVRGRWNCFNLNEWENGRKER
jgi:hypothetical protein